MSHSEAIIIYNEDDPIVIPLPNTTLPRIAAMCTALKASLDMIIGCKYRLPPKWYSSTWWQLTNHEDMSDNDSSDDDSESNNEGWRTV